jgi:5'-nucleotidase
MQKDFKIGLAIGVIFAVGVVLWLATLPNLSTRARAIQAALNINPSPKTPPYVAQPALSERSESSGPTSSIENRVSSIETPTTNNEQSTTPALSKAEGNSEPTQKIHIVQKGDTLSSISAKYYGSANQWRKILAANRDNLPDPNRLIPGSKLIIPQ